MGGLNGMTEHIQGVRERVISALGYPKSLMDRDIKKQICSHQHSFDQEQEACVECLYILECQCTSDKLELSQLQGRSTHELGKLLQFGIEYVTNHELRQGHREVGCDCVLCRWLRQMTPLVAEAGL
jgi:hypothetical protein